MNHGLVHYYFGSIEHLLVRALERFTERMIERQRRCTPRMSRSSRSGGPRWLPRQRGRPLPEDLDGAARAVVERRRAAGAPRARERRVAGRPARRVLRAARELGIEHAAGRAGLARDHLQRSGSSWSACGASRPGIASSWTGSTNGSRRASRPRRADAGDVPRRVRLRRARRRALVLRGVRLGRADGLPDADVVDHPLAPLEDADPVPGAALPGADVRRARQRTLGPARGAATPRRDFAPTHWRSWTPPRPSRRCSSPSRCGAQRSLLLAADHPDRVEARRLHLPVRAARRDRRGARRARLECAARVRRGLGRSTTATTGCANYRDFLEFFFGEMFSEPHSTKPFDDAVGWGLETTPETLVRPPLERELDEEQTRALVARVSCPVLVIQGTDDRITGAGPWHRACGGDRR